MTKKDNPIIITSILIFLSFILVIFSFIAPIIFTRNSIFPEIDFTNKGEIGDTIGGNSYSRSHYNFSCIFNASKSQQNSNGTISGFITK